MTTQPAPTIEAPSGLPEGEIDKSVTDELVALYERQSQRTGPAIGITAVIIAAAAWSRAPHGFVIAWVLAEWSTLAIRRLGFRALTGTHTTPQRKLRIAQLLRGLHALTNACAVLFFPYLSDLGRTMVTLILAGLTTGAIGTSGGYLPVYLVYAGPVMGALMLGWSITPFNGEDQWLARAMVPLLLAFSLVMVGLARDNFRAFRKSIAKRIEEVRLNHQLRAALEQAETANAAKTRFLASASHDLRQPLHSLSLFFATLRLQVNKPENVQLLDHIDQALTSLQTQMNTLLDMSKLDAGMVHLHWRSFALQLLLEQIQAAYIPVAHQKGVALTVTCAPHLVVNSDHEQLSRVLRNLVDNAVKYTQQGGVHIEALEHGDSIEVRISDTGCGIAAPLHKQVFEEFFQIDNPERDRNRGLGLGLSIVRRLTTLLYVELHLQSTPGRGTTITLTIPRGSMSTRVTPAVDPRDIQPSMPMCNVLVLDDEMAVRVGMQALLKRMGCEVMLASCISEALEHITVRQPDLVLADLRLRGQENGIDAVKQLRQHIRNLPAIIITGDTAPDRLKQAQAAGLPVLHKPVAPEALMTAIARSLDAAI
ncbi:MAG TPA: ATP-binding protein [Aquabacterium sp.]|uniref:ATP-binding response regulator n=1 Tax=Aquabacterium sp. TaxID=1872578 RepID=UPI002E31CBC7|nr:ATP-binding protein [Aquabacterium sp.]HEX5354756.1 ATP-binding protein [Aquabacterium sp.]